MATKKTEADVAEQTVTAEASDVSPVSTRKRASIAHRLYTGDISYDFVAKRNRWYLISAALLLVSILAVVFNGFNWGIEFRGGVDFQAPVKVTATTITDVRAAVDALNIAGQDDINVTTIGDSQVSVQTQPLSPEDVTKVKQAIATAVGAAPEDVAYSQIGASWGQQITTQALIALAVFLVLVMALIWIYFREFKMSVAGIVALIHDLVITIGVYALVGFTVTPATMIGILTILGYSLYDTVVVFDKIRENTKDLTNTKLTYSQAANTALNQVLVRSLNTTIIGVLPVAALLFTGWFILGTGPLKDLGLALFVGMVAGAYSSIFIATPLLTQMRETDADMVEHRDRLAKRQVRSAERAAAQSKKAATVTLGADGADVVTPGLVSGEKVSGPRQQPNKQSRSKRKN
ncbi:MAG: protein translocase subunit SecF [Actinobacteria bacterium HGW-Actinobacteria-2]|nr:MAG: protein translocase subunit SecF [Actinobacteria bacterium HGW-Actinobacteria-2]